MAGTSRAALLVVDVQNDFCPGGALAVRDGDQVVAPLNRLMARAALRHEPVYATRDWHPPDTTHFRASGGTWPPHCVAGTPGAAFHPGLRLPPTAVVITKGDTSTADGYSAFEGHTPAGSRLVDDLRSRGVDTLDVGGLATDYCVRQSVLDALAAGFTVRVVTDAVRGVDLQPGDSDAALDEMRQAGAALTTSADLLAGPTAG